MKKVAFKILGFEVYFYGIIYALAMLIFAFLFVKKLESSTSKKKIETLLIRMFVYNIFFARLFHCVFYNFSYFSQNPVDVFDLRKGGMSFFGGITGVGICVYLNKKIILHKNNLVNFLILSDKIASSSYISVFLVRIGNFINKEIVGKPINSSEFMSTFGCDFGDDVSRHPVQIYEALAEGILPFIITSLRPKSKRNPGYSTALFFIIYGVGRFLCEFLKDKEVMLVGLNINQIFSTLIMSAGLYIFFLKSDLK